MCLHWHIHDVFRNCGVKSLLGVVFVLFVWEDVRVWLLLRVIASAVTPEFNRRRNDSDVWYKRNARAKTKEQELHFSLAFFPARFNIIIMQHRSNEDVGANVGVKVQEGSVAILGCYSRFRFGSSAIYEMMMMMVLGWNWSVWAERRLLLFPSWLGDGVFFRRPIQCNAVVAT